MYPCNICGKKLHGTDIKYHTADQTKVFCGAECSLKYYTHLREEKNEEEN